MSICKSKIAVRESKVTNQINPTFEICPIQNYPTTNITLQLNIPKFAFVKKYPEHKIKVPQFKEELGFYTTPERSKMMGKIKGTDTKPEVKFRKALWHKGYRYRTNVRKLPGAPDLVFRKQKLAVFIDGEFWHGYNWETKKHEIKSNKDFWIPKIERNMQRDHEVNVELVGAGWTVIRFWEHQVKKDFENCLRKVVNHLLRFDSREFD